MWHVFWTSIYCFLLLVKFWDIKSYALNENRGLWSFLLTNFFIITNIMKTSTAVKICVDFEIRSVLDITSLGKAAPRWKKLKLLSNRFLFLLDFKWNQINFVKFHLDIVFVLYWCKRMVCWGDERNTKQNFALFWQKWANYFDWKTEGKRLLVLQIVIRKNWWSNGLSSLGI